MDFTGRHCLVLALRSRRCGVAGHQFIARHSLRLDSVSPYQALLHHSTTPPLHYSTTPLLHYSLRLESVSPDQMDENQ